MQDRIYADWAKLFGLDGQEMVSSIQVELVTDFCEIGHEISNPVKPKIFLRTRKISASADRLIGAS
jgi:hypothetical protein